jgi:hypothetical protein
MRFISKLKIRIRLEPITLMKMIQLPDFDMVQFDTKREVSLYPNGHWSQVKHVLAHSLNDNFSYKQFLRSNDATDSTFYKLMYQLI